MSGNDTATQPTVTTAAAKGAARRQPEQLKLRHVALVALLVLGGGLAVVRNVMSTGADAGFVDFRPDVSMFPAAPVADASTVFGVGSPIGWPYGDSSCPYYMESLPYQPAWREDWRTVRHDWEVDGEAKAWIVSERTIGFRDPNEFDEYVQSFRDQIRYCGWMFSSMAFGSVGFSSIATEMDGLPDDAIAITIDVAPQSRDARGFQNGDPDEFRAFGAFLPGPKRGELMNVVWIGWGADIPQDEFVAAVNTLYDAAHSASKKDYSGANKSIDFDFTEFEPERSGIIPIVGGDAELDDTDELHAIGCWRQYPDDDIWEYSAVDDIGAQSAVGNDSLNVTIGASRWRERSRYLEAKDLSVDLVGTPCISSLQSPELYIEPITMPGLPEGTIVSRWTGNSHLWDNFVGGYGALITDDDKQMLMTVTWWYEAGEDPGDKFAEVVNRAWEQFQADNP